MTCTPTGRPAASREPGTLTQGSPISVQRRLKRALPVEARPSGAGPGAEIGQEHVDLVEDLRRARRGPAAPCAGPRRSRATVIACASSRSLRSRGRQGVAVVRRIPRRAPAAPRSPAESGGCRRPRRGRRQRRSASRFAPARSAAAAAASSAAALSGSGAPAKSWRHDADARRCGGAPVDADLVAARSGRQARRRRPPRVAANRPSVSRDQEKP